MTKRLKIVRVSKSFMVSLLRLGVTLDDKARDNITIRQIKIPDLPDDAEFEAIEYDFNMRCFNVMVSHRSFPEVADGESIPVIDRLYEYIKMNRKLEGWELEETWHDRESLI